jgi:hypothetical protein
MVEEPGTENLLSMMQNMDVDKVGSVLKEFEKYEKILDKVSGITMRLNRIGVLPAILRIAGQKSGIENLDAPLPKQSELSIEAKSPVHLIMFKELNNQPEDIISETYKQMIIVSSSEGQKEKKPKK